MSKRWKALDLGIWVTLASGVHLDRIFVRVPMVL